MSDGKVYLLEGKAQGRRADRPALRAEAAQDHALESCVD
jgi:hypothetical protein